MSTSSSQVVLSAADFINSIGVNTPIGASAAYNNAALLTDSLNYLGVTKIRTGLTSDAAAVPVEAALAAEGYKFEITVSSTVAAAGSAGIASFVKSLDAFEKANPGSVLAIEGMNEVDIQGFTYNGSSTVQAAAAFQSALYKAVKADATLANTSVYNFSISDYNNDTQSSLVSDGASTDYANAHAYVSTYTTPQASLARSIGLAEQMTGGGSPIVITETGYSTLAGSSILGVDETVQAKSILDTLMDAFKDGVSSTYLYQLLDNNNLSPSSGQAHFGLFNADGTPKLAATAIHNLTSILADTGTGKAGTGTTFNYSLGNLPSSGSSMVLAKSGGVYDLVVWAEPKIWNPASAQEIANKAQTVSVDLGSTYASVKVYDPLVGTDPIATYANAETLSIAITDHPLIIEVSSSATSTPAVSSPAHSSSMSGTAASIVAQMSTLNADTALTSITLTDTNVLTVASASTMTYMIAHYQHALGAIQGNYQFAVKTSDTNWSSTVFYDSTGKHVSTTSSAYLNGVITSSQTTYATGKTDTTSYNAGVAANEIIINADKSRVVYAYNLTGQAFTSAEADYNAAGAMTEYVQRYANGTTQMDETISSTGDKSVTYYTNAGLVTSTQFFGADGSVATGLYTAGIATAKYVTNADKSQDNYFYNIKGQSYTSEHLHLTAAGVVTGTYMYNASGALVYSKVIGPNGIASVQSVASAGLDVASYNTAGVMVSDVLTAADGSVTTSFYTGGLKTKAYKVNADKTQDNYIYNISGQSYSSEHDHVTASCVIDVVERYYANGKLSYSAVTNKDGSKVTDTYNTSGVKTGEVTVTAKSTTTDQYVNGVIASEQVNAADGNVTTTLYAAGVKSKVYVANTNKTQDNYVYNITGQSYTSEHDHLNASGAIDAIQRYYANGKLAYSSATGADGSKVTDTYSTSGVKTSEVTVTSSATTTDQFDANGVITSELVKAADGSATTSLYTAGVKSKMYVAHGDKTQDNYFYNIAGQSYVSEHDHLNASGVIDTVTRTAADGSQQVKAYAAGLVLSGSKGNDTFTSAGGDKFSFTGSFGKDTIQNFAGGSGSSHDVLQFSKSTVSDFAHLSVIQSGNNAIVSAGSNGTVTLLNTHAASLTSSNFAFV